MLSSLLSHLGTLLVNQLYWIVGLSALFTVLALVNNQACNPGKPWWKSRDLLTDTHYGFLMPIITPYAKMGTLVVAVVLMHGAMTDAQISDYIENSRGPIGQLPVWVQVVFYMLGFDFVLYWMHRLFHGHTLWPFHAVHHSAVDLDWTTTYRSHPINQMLSSGLASTIMLLAGVSPAIMVALVPFDTITAAMVHANLNWTFGPLKYLVASPVFHRWHHTGVDEGGERNFSSTFAIWDVMFGTFYMPEGKLPKHYGVDDPLFPQDWAGQMIVPFRQVMQRLQSPQEKVVSSPPQA
jgi:sterol desaturase/sphingolipid hydroxylase (fatty acid hydroxylase superfamily)